MHTRKNKTKKLPHLYLFVVVVHRFYIALFRSRADSSRSHVIVREWLAFYSAFLNIHWSGVLSACMAAWCHMKLLPSRCVLHGGETNTEIRVSSESWLWRRTFSHRSCRDSNPRPFNHESGALTTELSSLPISVDYSANLWRLHVRWQENEWLQLRKPVSRYRNISVILNYGSLASWQEDRLARNGRFSSTTAAPVCTQIKPFSTNCL